MLATAVANKSAPTSGPVKATTQPVYVKTGTTPTPPVETTSVSSASNDSHNATLVSSPETNLTSVPSPKETAPKPQAAVPKASVPTAVKAEKTDPNTAEQPEIEASKLTAASTHSPVTESGAVLPSAVAAKVAMAGTVQSTGRQTQLSTQDSITKAAQADHYIKKTQATKSSQQVEMQLTLQEPHLEAKAEITAAGTDSSITTTADVDIISSEETTKSIAIKVRLCSVIYFIFYLIAEMHSLFCYSTFFHISTKVRLNRSLN